MELNKIWSTVELNTKRPELIIIAPIHNSKSSEKNSLFIGGEIGITGTAIGNYG